MIKYESINYQKKLACRILEINDSKENLLCEDYHYHRSIEILLPIVGGLMVSSNGRSNRVESNTVILINSKDIHNIRPFFHQGRYHGFIFQISHEMLEYCYPNYSMLYFDNNAIDQDIIKEMLMNMIEVKNKKDNLYILELTKLTFDLMKVLLATASKKRKYLPSDDQRRIIIEILDYIKRNFASKIKISTIATQFHYSYGYLEKIFKDNTGITIQNYLNHIRLQHAEIALLNTNRTILEVSEQCGFSNLKSMQRCFKQTHQLTPYQFRKKHAKKILVVS